MEKSYAGLWIRIKARLLDMVVLAPVILVLAATRGAGPILSSFAVVFVSYLAAFYFLYCHAKWGRTAGKWWYDLKVAKPDGSPIGWRESSMRSLFDIAWAVAWSWSEVMAIQAVPPEMWPIKEHPARFIATLRPSWFDYPEIASQVWFVLDIGLVLALKKKQSLHDLLGKTVVIHLPMESKQKAPADSSTSGRSV